MTPRLEAMVPSHALKKGALKRFLWGKHLSRAESMDRSWTGFDLHLATFAYI